MHVRDAEVNIKVDYCGYRNLLKLAFQMTGWAVEIYAHWPAAQAPANEPHINVILLLFD